MTARMRIELFGKTVEIYASLDTISLQMEFLDAMSLLLKSVHNRFETDADVDDTAKAHIVTAIEHKQSQIRELQRDAHSDYESKSKSASLKVRRLPTIESSGGQPGPDADEPSVLLPGHVGHNTNPSSQEKGSQSAKYSVPSPTSQGPPGATINDDTKAEADGRHDIETRASGYHLHIRLPTPPTNTMKTILCSRRSMWDFVARRSASSESVDSFTNVAPCNA